MKDKTKKECDTCIFYTVYHMKSGAQCHRYAPINAGWPKVKRDDSCGEHTNKSVIKKKITVKSDLKEMGPR